MASNSTDSISPLVFNRLLNFAIETKRNHFRVSEFYRKCVRNLLPLSESDLVAIVNKTKDIFKVNEFREGLVFYLAEKPHFCIRYNESSCSKHLSCPFFHICKFFLANENCDPKKCGLLDHTFNTNHNQQIFDTKNLPVFDYSLLIKYFQEVTTKIKTHPKNPTNNNSRQLSSASSFSSLIDSSRNDLLLSNQTYFNSAIQSNYNIDNNLLETNLKNLNLNPDLISLQNDTPQQKQPSNFINNTNNNRRIKKDSISSEASNRAPNHNKQRNQNRRNKENNQAKNLPQNNQNQKNNYLQKNHQSPQTPTIPPTPPPQPQQPQQNTTLPRQNFTSAPEPLIFLSNNLAPSNKVEVHLPATFVASGTKSLLISLFREESISGGGEIEACDYMPESLKAVLTFKNEAVARRVVEQGEINYLDFKFRVLRMIIKEKMNNLMDVNIEPSKQNSFDNNERKNKGYFQLVKNLDNNKLLGCIVSERNKEWRKSLIEIIENELNARVEVNERGLTVKSKGFVKEKFPVWSRKVNTRIGQFFTQFKMEKIKYTKENRALIESLIEKVNEIRKIYLLDYFDDRDKMSFDLVGRKIHLEDFFGRFSELSSLRRGVESRNDAEDSDIIVKTIQLPKNYFHAFIALINLSLPKLKDKFELDECDFDSSDLTIELTGRKSNVDSAEVCLNKSLTQIKSRKIDFFTDVNMIQAKNLNLILKDVLKSVEGHCFKVFIQTGDDEHQQGIFIAYFENCPDLDSDNDSVFQTICKYLQFTVGHLEIDATEYEQFLLSEKWKAFEKENLVDVNNYSFSKGFNKKGQMVMYLTGKKTSISRVKFSIENFLKMNQLTQHSMRINHEDVLYFKHVSVNYLSSLQDIFSVKIEIKETIENEKKVYDLVINESSEDAIKEVKTLVNEELHLKRNRKCKADNLPGIKKYFDGKNNALKADLDVIQKETNTFIEPILKEEKLAEILNTAQPQTSAAANVNNQQKIITIGKSKIILEVGSIIDIKTDVIVNSTSPKLNLNCGKLSYTIFQAAGASILNECSTLYPNGINENLVAVTSAGNIKNVSNIFHVTSTEYKDNYSCVKSIEKVLNNCMSILQSRNLTSISFPAIGTGALGYPPALVAQNMIYFITRFLDNNPAQVYNVNLVLSPQFQDILKEFEIEFDRARKTPNNNTGITGKIFSFFKSTDTASNSKEEQPKIVQKNKYSIEFRIIYREEKSFQYDLVTKKISDLIYTKYVIKETLDLDANANITKDEIEQELGASIGEHYEIDTKEPNRIVFNGAKDEIADAKLKITNLMNKRLKAHYTNIEKQVQISKNVQWQYDFNQSEWKDFSTYLNSLIETNFAANKTHVSFKNEDNFECIVYFNIKPMIYRIGANNFKIQRLELDKVKKESILVYPNTWTKINSEKDYELVDVAKETREFKEVYEDFAKKMSGTVFYDFKLKRIENKILYRQYKTFEERLIKKGTPTNEKTLFHGTRPDSVENIYRFGFDRNFCGVNGVAFGQGVYFAVNSSYSHGYTTQNNRKMFRARVFVGETTQGNSSMRKPPNKNGGIGSYDSTCDSGQTIFVAYHDCQCYPEYLIEYKDGRGGIFGY